VPDKKIKVSRRVMKKFVFLFLMLCCSYGSYAIDLDGKYQSQSGELLFRFKGDSLYIDIAQSHRNVSSFKLVKKKDSKKAVTYNAFESYLVDGNVTYREVLIKVTRLKNRKFLLEYFGKDKDRDYTSSERYHIKKIE
jgi:hypothetical protein